MKTAGFGSDLTLTACRVLVCRITTQNKTFVGSLSRGAALNHSYDCLTSITPLRSADALWISMLERK